MNMYARQAVTPMNNGARPHKIRITGNSPPTSQPNTRKAMTMTRNRDHEAHENRRSQSKNPLRMLSRTTKPTRRKPQPITPKW